MRNKTNSDILFITGAGVSAASGIPTFRGEEGYWTIGSKNYTPQEMATCAMYESSPDEFLLWYYERFITYRNHGPNIAHDWLSDKNLITQNIDGLDGKAGNKDYISVHGRIDKMTIFDDAHQPLEIITAPWEEVTGESPEERKEALLDLFRIKAKPERKKSFKPYVLLFDEYYTDLYRITEAKRRMMGAKQMIFIGTSFSVNITQMALDIAQINNIPIEVVDPNPVETHYSKTKYHRMTAIDYVQYMRGT